MSHIFLTTQAPEHTAVYTELHELRKLRFKYFRELVTAAGFDEYGGEDFCTPRTFYKKATGTARKGPAIEGFKGGESHWEGSDRYFKYTVHGKQVKGTDFRKQLEACPHQLEADGHMIRRTLSAFVCQRLGLPTEVFTDSKFMLSHVHMLKGSTLALCIPFDNANPPDGAPSGFTEVTELQFCKLIEEHNASLAVQA
jgi:hypothetical protein